VRSWKRTGQPISYREEAIERAQAVFLNKKTTGFDSGGGPSFAAERGGVLGERGVWVVNCEVLSRKSRLWSTMQSLCNPFSIRQGNALDSFVNQARSEEGCGR